MGTDLVRLLAGDATPIRGTSQRTVSFPHDWQICSPILSPGAVDIDMSSAYQMTFDRASGLYTIIV